MVPLGGTHSSKASRTLDVELTPPMKLARLAAMPPSPCARRSPKSAMALPSAA
jgi:hypothetical protein